MLLLLFALLLAALRGADAWTRLTPTGSYLVRLQSSEVVQSTDCYRVLSSTPSNDGYEYACEALQCTDFSDWRLIEPGKLEVSSRDAVELVADVVGVETTEEGTTVFLFSPKPSSAPSVVTGQPAPLRARLERSVKTGFMDKRMFWVEERWTFEHVGPKSAAAGLQPIFEQRRLATDGRSSKAVATIPFMLPIDATLVKVKDGLGWIQAFSSSDYVLRVSPRYPLLSGGWRAAIWISYSSRFNALVLPFDMIVDVGDKALTAETASVLLADKIESPNRGRGAILGMAIAILGALYLARKGKGGESREIAERSKVLLSLRSASDLGRLTTASTNAELGRLYSKQVELLKLFFQTRSPKVAKECIALDELLIDVEARSM